MKIRRGYVHDARFIRSVNRLGKQDAFSRLKVELKTAITAHYKRLTSTITDIYGYDSSKDETPNAFELNSILNDSDKLATMRMRLSNV